MTLFLSLLAAGLLADPGSRSAVLSQVNQIRAAHGLSALYEDSDLDQAAEGHAVFMSENHKLTHREDPQLPGFSGASLADRAGKVGWSQDCSELVGYASTCLEDSVKAIFDSPTHRLRFLKAGRLPAGVAAAGNYVCLLVGGTGDPSVVLSPPDGSTGIPTTWYSSPDYSGTQTIGGLRLGYPCVASFPQVRSSYLQVNDAFLTDDQGTQVPVLVRDPSNDSHYDFSLALIPKSPLKPCTKYTAHVSADIRPTGQILKTWSFTTK